MGKYVVKSGSGRTTASDYISEGLIKSLTFGNIGVDNYIIIDNIKDIALFKEMTVECCCLYEGFTNSEKKGTSFFKRNKRFNRNVYV